MSNRDPLGPDPQLPPPSGVVPTDSGVQPPQPPNPHVIPGQAPSPTLAPANVLPPHLAAATQPVAPIPAAPSPIPGTPIPVVPVVAVPVPQLPTLPAAVPAIPVQPVPQSPTSPLSPVPQPVVVQVPAPQTPAPQTPAPQTPAPQVPAPQTPAPQTPAPQAPAPQAPAPQAPAPQAPAPQVPAPQPAARIPSPPVPQARATQPAAPQSKQLAPEADSSPPTTPRTQRSAPQPTPAPQARLQSKPAVRQRPAPSTPVPETRADPTPTPAAPIQADPDPDTPEDDHAESGPLDKVKELASKLAINEAPPWLVSMLVHLGLVMCLALYYLPDVVKAPFVVEIAYGEDMGEQMIDDTQLLDAVDTLEVAPALTTDPEPTEDPLAVLPELDIQLDIFENANTDVTAPTIGLALSGREAGSKRALLAAYGGNGETEDSVALALQWLKRQQQRDGTWKLDGPYSDGVIGAENRLAATAMAMLAFQGGGNTHLEGEHSDVVAKGKDALLVMLDRDGCFFSSQSLQNQHQLYSQGQATIALCELYGMTKDKSLKEPAQRTLDYAISIQATVANDGGGWRYNPGDGVDTSVTGWFVMALQSGQMAQLVVPSEPLRKIGRFLDGVTTDGSQYGYKLGEAARISMTAEALLCRQYLGWSHSDPRLVRGMEEILDNPIDWDPPNIQDTPNVYYWYYATQVAHHMGGEHWDRWNQVMRKEIPRMQVKTGRERGSWSPAGDRFGAQGGRLYMTCFCAYMLESYYRHLPIYQH